MGMTITEKILAKAGGKTSVQAGHLVNAKVDMIMCHDPGIYLPGFLLPSIFPQERSHQSMTGNQKYSAHQKKPKGASSYDRCS